MEVYVLFSKCLRSLPIEPESSGILIISISKGWIILFVIVDQNGSVNDFIGAKIIRFSSENIYRMLEIAAVFKCASARRKLVAYVPLALKLFVNYFVICVLSAENYKKYNKHRERCRHNTDDQGGASS